MRHGGDLASASRRYGIAEDEWLDLSTGINPRPWPGAAALSVPQMRLDRLPAAAALEQLVAAACRAYGVPPGLAVAAAPGSEAIIRALPRFLDARAVLTATSYSSYAEAWHEAGQLLATEETPERAADDAETSLILVNPNNPDGRVVPPKDLLVLARGRHGGALVIVDEAFADAEECVSVVPHLSEADPVLVLKSFGKFFGLPGLRLGFAVGPAALVARVAASFGDWPVSGPALAIGSRALGDIAWQEETRRWVAEQARRLDAVLTGSGLAVIGGTHLFRLVRHADAAALQRRLAREAIWTRVWVEGPELMRFGLPADEAGLKRLGDALAAATAD